MTAAKKTAAKTTAKTGATKAVAKVGTSPKTEKKAVAANAPVVTTLASREGHFSRIQKEAYLLAEKDGFKGDPTKYWLAAEANVIRAER